MPNEEKRAMSIQPLEIVNPQFMNFFDVDVFPVPGSFAITTHFEEVVATGVALLDLRGISDNEYRREDVTFTIPSSDGSPFILPQVGRYNVQTATIAFPATVEFDGPGVLGWGVDTATTDLVAFPPNSNAEPNGGFVLHARVVVRSTNTVILRMGYQVTAILISAR
jgi:hypothetical protein